MPRSACLLNRRSTICLPVASSRLPVGSSATRIVGSGASARERDALLFAAGELRRIMMQSVAEPDRLQLLRRALRSVGIAGKLERDGDVLERRHGRDQMEGLEDDADLAAAEAGQRVLVEGIERRA